MSGSEYAPPLGSPRRIQRKRTREWRMPENTVSVCRPGKWGNPHKVGAMVDGKPLSTWGAVGMFHADLITGALGYTAKDVIRELRGKNLACFCGLDKPCHADVLLRVANVGVHARGLPRRCATHCSATRSF